MRKNELNAAYVKNIPEKELQRMRKRIVKDLCFMALVKISFCEFYRKCEYNMKYRSAQRQSQKYSFLTGLLFCVLIFFKINRSKNTRM